MKKQTLKALLVTKKLIKKEINELRRKVYAVDKEIDKRV